MPGGDRTGPEGYGPRTGRNLGYCAGYNSPGFTEGISRGRGFGQGRSRGYGRGFLARGRGFWHRGYQPDPYRKPSLDYKETYSELSREDEKAHLENIVRGIEGELKAIKERIQELSKEK